MADNDLALSSRNDAHPTVAVGVEMMDETQDFATSNTTEHSAFELERPNKQTRKGTATSDAVLDYNHPPSTLTCKRDACLTLRLSKPNLDRQSPSCIFLQPPGGCGTICIPCEISRRTIALVKKAAFAKIPKPLRRQALEKLASDVIATWESVARARYGDLVVAEAGSLRKSSDFLER